jgi:hypothetical protein
MAGAALALFLLVNDVIWPSGSEWKQRANDIEAAIAEVRRDAGLSRSFVEMQSTVIALGPVQMPATEAEGNAALNQIYNTVRKNHAISNDSFELSKATKLTGTPLAKLVGRRTVSRLTGNLKFDATPEVAMAVIAELESSPLIESISSVRITRDAQPKVKVQLTLETWVLTDAQKGAA